jgi:hypothetical protein
MGLPPSTADVAKSWLATTRGSHVSLGAFAAVLGDRGAGLLLLALTLPNVLFIPSVPVLPLIPGIPDHTIEQPGRWRAFPICPLSDAHYTNPR